jgi:hypothetical protein
MASLGPGSKKLAAAGSRSKKLVPPNDPAGFALGPLARATPAPMRSELSQPGLRQPSGNAEYRELIQQADTPNKAFILAQQKKKGGYASKWPHHARRRCAVVYWW